MTEHFWERKSCPACGEANAVVLCDQAMDGPGLRGYFEAFYGPQGGVEMEYLAGARYVVCRCAGCGLVYQKSIGSDALLTRLYGRWIDPDKVFAKYHAHRPIGDYQSLARQVMVLLTYFQGRVARPLRFLDFGMGWGEWCRMVGAFGVEAYGCELSESRLDHGRKFGIGVVPYERIPEERFDVINAEQVFEHLTEPRKMLEHLARGLNEEGLIHIAVPNGEGVERGLAGVDWRRDKGAAWPPNAAAPLEHINSFSQASLLKMAEGAGLRRVRFPILTQYAAAIDMRPVKPLLKSLAMPWFLNYVDRTNLWFTKK